MADEYCAQFPANSDTWKLCKKLHDSLLLLEEEDVHVVEDVNSFFLIWGGALVLFMHAGFAMLSAGAIRAKNTKNILISITMDLTVCAIAWYLLGYGFAFGNDYNGFIGSSYWVGIDVGSSNSGYASFQVWFFEWAFAATSATIVSGAIAERARFDTYLIYSFFVSIWVYPVGKSSNHESHAVKGLTDHSK
jgi:Amt family ammonium transporter